MILSQIFNRVIVIAFYHFHRWWLRFNA